MDAVTSTEPKYFIFLSSLNIQKRGEGDGEQ